MSDFAESSNGDSLSAHRMLDANLNRAQEAMRTLEDIARFRDQAVLQSEYKRLRHVLAHATETWDVALLLRSRNATLDVGREVKTTAEADRSAGFSAISQAASQRVQQALRCLEEGAKYQYPSTAATIEQIRYQIYDLNATLILSLQRDTDFLKNAKLYALADCRLPLDEFASRIASISGAGVDIIQIREKSKDAQEILEYTQAAIQSVDASVTRIIVNDRADLCQLSGAYGLHVGQSDLSVSQSRRILSPQSIVGLSTHDIGQVQQAMKLGADYIGCGPTFPSQTKSFTEFSGLAFLRSVAQEIDQEQLPAFAIGGINQENVQQVLDTGIKRIVIGSAIWNAANPEEATTQLKSKLVPPKS